MKKDKNMESKTTQELKEILSNPAKANQHAAALAELLHEDREITEEDTEDTSLRGGIRPTRRP
jgi:hypothetical protein